MTILVIVVTMIFSWWFCDAAILVDGLYRIGSKSLGRAMLRAPNANNADNTDTLDTQLTYVSFDVPNAGIDIHYQQVFGLSEVLSVF